MPEPFIWRRLGGARLRRQTSYTTTTQTSHVTTAQTSHATAWSTTYTTTRQTARATAHDTANLAPGAPTPVSSTGAVGHAVEQIATLRYAGALGNVARTTDDMLGSLIDMLG